MLKADQRPSEVFATEVLRGRKPVRPKTAGQKRYIDAVRDNTVTFAIGPAGTGKSYLAVALAVQSLQAKEINRIILTRPAVEAGERLGFLPGDVLAKVDPYLRPLYDALYDMLDAEVVARLMDRGTIEVAPLAFMRGRTLNDSFIILDEAQNTTPEQMKMFLTRLGFGSKVVVTGDVTQIDLPEGRGRSGLLAVRDILVDIDGLAFVELDRGDVVRHRIVQDIVHAYDARVLRGSDRGDARRPGLRCRRAERCASRRPAVGAPRTAGARRGAGSSRRGAFRALRLPRTRSRISTSASSTVRVPPTCWPSRSTTTHHPAAATPTKAGGAPGRRPRTTSRRSCSATCSCARPSPHVRRHRLGRPLEAELALLVVHGVLHLLDYDHAEPDDAVKMQRREADLLARFEVVERQTLGDATTDEPAASEPSASEEVSADGHE